jgi:hypothetical protein
VLQILVFGWEPIEAQVRILSDFAGDFRISAGLGPKKLDLWLADGNPWLCNLLNGSSATPLSKTVRNEKRKLSASWCNTLATAVLTAGAFAPLAALFYELTNSTVDRRFLLSSTGICVVGGFALHFFGRFLLERLEEP